MELLGDVGLMASRYGLLGDNVGVGASRCTICAKRTIGSEIVLDIMMVLLRDEAQVDACFVLFGDSAKLDARYVYGLCRTYHRLRNHFGCTPMERLGDVGHVEPRFDPFGDSVSVGAS